MMFVNISDPTAQYCLACPKCGRRYGMGIPFVDVGEADVRITYYCAECRRSSVLEVDECHIRWLKNEDNPRWKEARQQLKADRARAREGCFETGETGEKKGG